MILELKQNVATVQVIDHKPPELRRRSDPTDVVEPVQPVICSALLMPAQEIVRKQVTEDSFTEPFKRGPSRSAFFQERQLPCELFALAILFRHGVRQMSPFHSGRSPSTLFGGRCRFHFKYCLELIKNGRVVSGPNK